VEAGLDTASASVSTGGGWDTGLSRSLSPDTGPLEEEEEDASEGEVELDAAEP